LLTQTTLRLINPIDHLNKLLIRLLLTNKLSRKLRTGHKMLSIKREPLFWQPIRFPPNRPLIRIRLK
jgi:hypothetical protein